MTVQLTDGVKKKQSLVEDDKQAKLQDNLVDLLCIWWTLDIVGKSSVSNIFSQQDIFPRCMMNRIVKPSSVCIKQLNNMFSDYHISYFSSNCLIKIARCMDLLKLLLFSSLYQNGYLEAISDANEAMEREFHSG